MGFIFQLEAGASVRTRVNSIVIHVALLFLFVFFFAFFIHFRRTLDHFWDIILDGVVVFFSSNAAWDLALVYYWVFFYYFLFFSFSFGTFVGAGLDI